MTKAETILLWILGVTSAIDTTINILEYFS